MLTPIRYLSMVHLRIAKVSEPFYIFVASWNRRLSLISSDNLSVGRSLAQIPPSDLFQTLVADSLDI